jgi:hypothetical protein
MKHILLALVFATVAQSGAAFVMAPMNPARLLPGMNPDEPCIAGLVYDELEDRCVASRPGSTHDEEAFEPPQDGSIENPPDE